MSETVDNTAAANSQAQTERSIPEIDALLIARAPPLDASLYNLNPTEIAFFKTETGIQDDEELKKHILAVQAEAYKVYPYPCIRRFAFTTLKISTLPAYPQLLRLGKERPGAIYLEFASCFGNDARKAIADGYPRENVIASDLREEYWKLGHKLFRTTQETYPVPFVAGDVFDPAHIAPSPPITSPSTTPRPALDKLTSLTPLLGHVSAIHTSSFFHLFGEEDQFRAAKALAPLLSPAPGSFIFGVHGGSPEKGFRAIPNAWGRKMFCHSHVSWTELWDGGIFEKGTVKVEAEVVERKRASAEEPQFAADGTEYRLYWLYWSVTRL